MGNHILKSNEKSKIGVVKTMKKTSPTTEFWREKKQTRKDVRTMKS